MPILRNVLTKDGVQVDHEIPGEDTEWDCEGRLMMLPALCDAHVHFRTPGAEYKEDWIHAARAAVYSGITTVFDMPNTSPATVSLESWHEKCALIDSQLKQAGIPLRYKLYLGADAMHLDQVPKCRPYVAGLKIYMGSTTGDLLMADDRDIERAFAVGAENDLVVSVHAEDEDLIRARTKELFYTNAPAAMHSVIRCPEAAAIATEKAIGFAERHGTKLFVLHLSTAKELELIAAAKARGVRVYCEVSPHHLFLDTRAYSAMGTRAQMNPPLRDPEDCQALWEGIERGIVDSIGTDHAPHTLEEKDRPYGKAPSGVPGLETLLPLLMDAHYAGRLSMENFIKLTSSNVQRIFQLETHDDLVLVDSDCVQQVCDIQLQSKCQWTPYGSMSLRGWPVATVLRGALYTNPSYKGAFSTLCLSK